MLGRRPRTHLHRGTSHSSYTVTVSSHPASPQPHPHAGPGPTSDTDSDKEPDTDIEEGALPSPPQMGRGKIAQRLLAGGSEPDPRFTLANERTFLAWIRTSLALLAGGIAVEAFTADLFLEPVRKSIAILLLLMGMLLSGNSALRWLQVERSMRQNRPLPLPLMVPLLAIAGALAAVGIVLSILLG